MGYIPGLLYAVVLFLFTAPETETVSAKATIKRGGIAGGTVYVLSNPEIPGVVKIGHTTRSPTERARELSGTSVPGEYKVSYETKVDRPEKVEKEVHRKLSNHRASSGEFFEVSPRRAAKVIEEVS